MSQLQFYSVKSPCITEAKHQSHPATELNLTSCKLQNVDLYFGVFGVFFNSHFAAAVHLLETKNISPDIIYVYIYVYILEI